MPDDEKRKAYRNSWAKNKYASDPETHRAYARAMYEKHKEKKRVANARYREKNRERIRAQQREFFKNNPEVSLKHRLKRAGFTLELYADVLDYQENKCAICDFNFDEGPTKNRHADHCHATKAPRGVLCSPCNTALGLLKDSPERLQKAIEYLAEPPVAKLQRRKK